MTAEAGAAAWPGLTPPNNAGDPASVERALHRTQRLLEAQRNLACAPRDPDVVLEMLARCVLDLFAAESAVAAERIGDTLVTRAAGGIGGPQVGEIISDETLCDEVMRSGRPHVCRDRWAEQADLPMHLRSRHRSVIVLPLTTHGEPTGMVAALARGPGAFADEDPSALAMLADVASSALAGAVVHEQHQSAAARAAAVVEALGEGLIEIAADGRVLFANRVAEQILSFTWNDDATTRLISGGRQVLYPDGQVCPEQETPAAVTLRTGTPLSGVVIGMRAGAEVAPSWLLVNTRPVFDGSEVASTIVSFTDITEQRRLEEARQVDDARLRAAQELTGLAWWSLDLETGRHVWSDQMFRLLGLEPSAEPPNHDQFVALLHPDDQPAATELTRSGFYTGHGDVFRVVRTDGAVRYLQSWTSPEPHDSGVSTLIRGATIDVTDREEAAEKLRASRATLAAALELSGVVTWEWDIVSDRITWSDGMRRLMGHDGSSAAISLEDFFDYLHPDDRERMKSLGERQVSSRQGEATEYRVVQPDGSIRHVRALTEVRTAPDGTVLGLWGTAMDVTQEVETAARLAADEEHFRVAFDNAPIGMNMISLEPSTLGRFLRANSAFLDMLGYQEADVIGRPLTEITHADDVERDNHRFEQLVSGEIATASCEKRYRRHNGSIVHAWVTSAVVRDHEGNPLYLVSHAIDISERLREQAELERLALTDTLTGLANRTLLIDRLDQALARLQRSGDSCAMLLLDVDRFKLVNDSLGHLVGDTLLVEIAGRITDVSRADATVARLGGDEFVVLVEDVHDPEDLHNVATRLLDTLRRPYSLGAAAEHLVATVSMGIAVASTPDRTYVDLYREADLALYRAKDGGRDQYALFDDDLRARAESRMATEGMLRRALSDDRLVAHYQPLIDLEAGEIWGLEALARIPRDDGTFEMPGAFVDVAEETGLIVDLDGRMFELAVAEFARIRSLGLPLRRMGTNVSARSLEDPDFVERLRRALLWHDVPGDHVRIELTETSLLTSSQTVAHSVERMLELGMRIGLDDFGTGYSALAYLGRVSLQFLKIDRSFVSRLGRSEQDDAVVAAVIALAKAHELIVIGEGVETAEQLAALRSMGCDWAQGYLIARPMPAPELEALLARDPRW